MARTFTTGNRLGKAVAAASTYPFTLAAWVLMSSIAAGSKIVLTLNQSATPWTGYHTLFVSTATPTGETNPTAGDAVATSTVTTSAWAHIAYVCTSATSRTVYLNGANSGSNVVSSTPASINETLIGALRTGSATFLDGNQVVGFPAIWNIALALQDVVSLAAGAGPRRVHPEALVSYCRLDGNSPEQDMVSSTGFTLTGTPTVAANPRIFRS